jgi:hypothetical protein
MIAKVTNCTIGSWDEATPFLTRKVALMPPYGASFTATRRSKLRLLMLPILCAALLLVPLWAWAGEAHVRSVKAEPAGEGRWRLSVTVAHADSGWDHYADGWEILDEAGEVLDTRTLAHPHVAEQPFTRSLTTEKIPATLKRIRIRAHCSVHGYGGDQQWVPLNP